VGVAITPDGRRAYVTSYHFGTVSVVDTEPGSGTFHTVVDTLAVGGNPVQLAITPDGWFIYVARFNGASVSVIARHGDSDGCADAEEGSGAPAPKPGATGAYDPLAWYDFYDVPAPAYQDPRPNGPRDQSVNVEDVVGVLKYVGTSLTGACGDNANLSGVDYDCDKGVDTNGDTVADIPPDGVPDGRDYDRSPGEPPNPPYDSGPPSGAVNLQDVVSVLRQVGLSCQGPP